MYIAIYEKEIAGCHDNREVVEEFVEYQFEHWKRKLAIRKIPKRSWEEVSDRYAGKYLVTYGDNYIPSEDLDFIGFFNDPGLDYQCQSAMDLLFKLLETMELSGKNQKAIERTIAILSKVKNDCVIPSPDDMEYVKKHNQYIQEFI